MTDKRFLRWIHDRLVSVHHEDQNADYMHKLRAIIEDIDTTTVNRVVQIDPVDGKRVD